MSQTVIALNLRLPRDLHGKLVEAAKESRPENSLNREILERLFQSLEPPVNNPKK